MKLSTILGIRSARDKPKDSFSGSAYSFLFGRTTSGKPVNERTAMQTTAVYSCVRILAEAVASLPLHIYRYTVAGKERVVDHPLYKILNDEPNPDMTSFVFRETMMSHLLIWGNAYSQIIRDGAGRVIGLYPLLPDKMEVDRLENGELVYYYSRYSEENPNFREMGRIVLRQQDVLHIPGLGFDGLVGYSPIAMAKNAVGMTLACEEYGASFFANGANPGGVLEHPGVLKDPGKVRESWNSVYRGSNNAHKIAVLEEGMKYQQIGIPPEEAQFLETRKFQINEIARLYRIPPHMVGDLEKSSFSNIEQQSLEFVKYTLDPWVILWEQSLQKALLLPEEKKEYFIKLNVDGLLRGDYQSRMTGYATARQNGWMSANDIRELEDLNPIPEKDGGDLYLINGNMTKLKDAGLFAGKNIEKELT
ncbi:phage portal protein [Robinsoniella peoriensis]|uniref:phage portal protein n=1 Tax=Robinsoniella peoriensis TaxID=180332 RepID=UPI0005C7CEEA|nr:phage portal protein [Robinsoniella peoriensis]